MSIICNHCQGQGFVNIHLLPDKIIQMFEDDPEGHEHLLEYLNCSPVKYPDVAPCTCCGDGNSWYGIPGEHYNDEDPRGDDGPYAYNGGLCECH